MLFLLCVLLSSIVHKVLHYKDANEINLLLYSIKKKRYIIPIMDLYNVFYVVFL